MSNAKSSARFLIENCRVTRINRRDKVAFVSVYASTGKINQYIDITDFTKADGIGEGESVTVQGDVQVDKPEQGSRRWQIRLIARKWSAGKEELTPALPAPKASAPVEETAPSDDDVPF